MKKYLAYIILSISALLIYLSISIYIIKSNNKTNIKKRMNIEIYTIYLDGEVNYRGEIELKKGTLLKDFLYDYLTPYSDLSSIEFSDEIENYKTYYIDYKKKLNINTATKNELLALSGVGEVYSNAIIKGRPYKSVEELREKKIIGEALYNEIKNEICCE